MTEKKRVLYHNTHFMCSPSPDAGGGVCRLETKRCFSPTEMFARLSMSGVIADIKAHSKAQLNRPEFLAMREQFYRDVDSRSCPPRGVFVEKQDLQQKSKDVSLSLNKAFERRSLEIVSEEKERRKAAFDKAVSDEVARRMKGMSDPKNVG